MVWATSWPTGTLFVYALFTTCSTLADVSLSLVLFVGYATAAHLLPGGMCDVLYLFMQSCVLACCDEFLKTVSCVDCRQR